MLSWYQSFEYNNIYWKVQNRNRVNRCSDRSSLGAMWVVYTCRCSNMRDVVGVNAISGRLQISIRPRFTFFVRTGSGWGVFGSRGRDANLRWGAKSFTVGRIYWLRHASSNLRGPLAKSGLLKLNSQLLQFLPLSIDGLPINLNQSIKNVVESLSVTSSTSVHTIHSSLLVTWAT